MIELPRTLRTDAEKLAYLLRVHRKLIVMHNEQRAKLPAKLSAADRLRFKAWERDVWLPRHKAIEEQLATYRQSVVRGLDDDQAAERVVELKDAAKTDTRFDTDATTEMPTEFER